MRAGWPPASGWPRTDWNNFDATSAAELCIFRLLSAQGGIEHFKAFARAQGFRVDDESFSPTNPHIEQDGSQRVTASWSIREKGPKFPTTGLLRYLNAVPYIMGIDATWEVDGKTLGYVTLYFDTV